MKRRRRLSALLIGGLAVCIVGAAIAGVGLWRTRAWNADIRALDVAKVDEQAPPEAIFARAYRLSQKGEYDRALQLYNHIKGREDPAFRVAVNYNMGNIYLRLARREAANARIKDVVPLVGTARKRYQQALHLDSHHYNAKYNLEYTRFLVSERRWKKTKLKQGISEERGQRQRNWATLQDMPQGLP